MLKYLARYTHCVAISNRRVLSLEDGHVTFRHMDYRGNGRGGIMRLHATQPVRRFPLHVLPEGFVRIRHFLAANGNDPVQMRDWRGPAAR